jgi:hypothetical protein
MSLVACGMYVKGLLDGQTSPALPPAQAWWLPPPVTQTAKNPQIYVWITDFDEQRATIPRGQGQKRVAHTATLFLQWSSGNKVATEQNFPLFIDAIRQTLRSTDLRIPITDPTTGEKSQLTDFGEQIKMKYPTPITTADQRTILYTATLTVPFHEWINPD